MLNVIDKIEEIAKRNTITGIIGWFKDYQSERYPSYCLEPLNQNISREFVGSDTNSPNLKLYYIEDFVNSNYNVSSRDFFERAEVIIKELENDKTFGGLVSQFNMKVKYGARKVKNGMENVCEILIDIDEIL